MINGIITHLKALEEIKLLGSYDFGGGDYGPAIFTEHPAPRNAPNPVLCVTMAGESERVALSRAQRGGILQVTLNFWFDKGTSDQDNRRLPLAVYKHFDRSRFALESGWENAGCSCTLPGKMTDKDGFPGYQMILAIRVVAE